MLKLAAALALVGGVPLAGLMSGGSSASSPVVGTTTTSTPVAKSPPVRHHRVRGCNSAACDARVLVKARRHARYLRAVAAHKRAVEAAKLRAGLPWVRVSMFSPPDAGGKMACGGGYLGWGTLGVAHRTKRCGSLVTVCARSCARVPVIDRGPYANGAEYDLSVATAGLIGFTAGVGDIRATP